MTMHIYVAYKTTCRDSVFVLNFWCISQLPMLHVGLSIVNEGWNYVTTLVAPPNDLWHRLVRWLQVQPGEIDDYTTASNICLRISNIVYCSTMLRILINSLGPRKPRCKFKSSVAIARLKRDGLVFCNILVLLNWLHCFLNLNTIMAWHNLQWRCVQDLHQCFIFRCQNLKTAQKNCRRENDQFPVTELIKLLSWNI